MDEEEIQEALKAIQDAAEKGDTKNLVAEAWRPTSQMWIAVKDMLAEDWPEDVAIDIAQDLMRHNFRQQIDEVQWNNRVQK